MKTLQVQVLETRTRVLGPEHPDRLVALGNLANILYQQGDYAGARDPLEQVVELQTRISGPEHPDTLRTEDILDAVLAEAAEEPAESPAP